MIIIHRSRLIFTIISIWEYDDQVPPNKMSSHLIGQAPSDKKDSLNPSADIVVTDSTIIVASIKIIHLEQLAH